ncbi:MAG: imidazole glycerol phosphate synthase subunit HisH [Bacteroidetes bacterium]|nr:imidazole glycerol phosphate synthase subunit HisH [Bacteroidota bacterium]
MIEANPLPEVSGEVVIVKYNAGNVRSVTCALNRLGIEPVLTDDPDRIRNADRVIFPGVGEASSAMNYLRRTGLDTVLKNLTQPFLGICLGMQLMCKWSQENDTECLGIFNEDVLLFPPKLKVPHMGWNNLSGMRSPLLAGVTTEEYFYFVHSFYAAKGAETIAACDYIIEFSAALQKGNYYGLQFHPEKSSKAGETILRNFLGMKSVDGENG